jgi:hypothetical protein
MPKSRPNRDAKVIAWLLEDNQPAVRYRTLTELLGRKQNDLEVRAARKNLLKSGWAAEILARRIPKRGWADGRSTYQPKYVSTNWMMIVLSELGASRDDPGVREACEYWMDDMATKDGGLGGNSAGTPHYCVSANQARSVIRLGYADDPRVRRTLEWLVETAHPKGGWSCWGMGSRNLDSWEALSAFAVYPRSKWTASMRSCVERGAEFFLSHELHRQGARYAPWYRTHYPVHYYYDLLVGLDLLSALGYAGDPRMGYALTWLTSRRRADGSWNLDSVHPEDDCTYAGWWAKHPKRRPTPFALEQVGKPSKMITLTALKVLAAVDAAATGPGAPR